MRRPHDLLVSLALIACLGCSGRIGDPIGGPGGSGAGAGGSSSGGSGGGGGGIGSAQAHLFGATTFRLTSEQYKRSVLDVFGSGIDLSDVSLDPDESTERFSTIGAAKVASSTVAVEKYRDAALAIAERVMAKAPGVYQSCQPSKASDSCVAELVRSTGRLLFRRPLSDAELASYQTLIGSQGEDPQVLRLGMQYALAAMLMSPSFLYVPQIGVQDASGRVKLTGYELASRLSYLIWSSTPDDALLSAAAAGDLDSAAGVKAEVERMLADGRARGLATRFFGEAYKVSRLSVVDKKAAMFPAWNAQLLSSYLGEFSRFIEDITFDSDRDVRDLFDADYTFIDDTLASAYGLPAPKTSGFSRVAVGEQRAGLLTSGAVIAANSPSDRTSPTHRGLLVVERILCVDIPPPPDNVNEQAVGNTTANEGKTLRERLEQHRTDPACAGCHSMFDPAGFVFEHYDAIGLYRSTEGGKPVDSAGELDGTKLDSVKQLAAHVKSDPRTTRCIVKRFYEFATGHDMTIGEKPLVDRLEQGFIAGGRRFKALVLAITSSDAFRFYERP